MYHIGWEYRPWPGDEPESEYDEALENAAFPMPQQARHLSDEDREEIVAELLSKMDAIGRKLDHARQDDSVV